MGKVYYDMGILGSDEVVESSATDFVGQYIGHTGPKTQELLEKALGRVLLIDEAYRLADGQFAKEAMDEIVDCITKPKFAGKLIIILAGYNKDINRLTDINPGLTSRFPDSIEFDGLNPDACLKLLRTVFQTQQDELLHKRTLMDISCLEGPTSDFSRDLQSRFLTLTGLPNWANGRDIKTLAKSIFGKAVRTLVTGNVVITERGILTELDCMIKERKHRLHYNLSKAVELPAAPADLSLNPASSNTEASTNTQTHLPQLQSEVEEPSKTENFSAIKNRDAGITDEVWNQLIQDKQTSIKQEGTYRDLLKQEQQLERDRNNRNEENEGKKNEGTKQQLEQEQLQQELERQAKEEELRKIQKIKAEMEAQHKKEQQAQKKLREIGVCIQGFRWIKQAGGYRCAGGSHYVSDGQLGI